MSSILRHKLRVLRVFFLALTAVSLALGGDLVTSARRLRRTGPPGNITNLAQGSELALIGAYGNSNFGDDIVALGILSSVDNYNFDDIVIVGRRPDFTLLKNDIPHARFAYCGDGFSGIIRTFKALQRGSGVAILGGGGLLEGKRDDINVHRLVLEYCAKIAIARLRGYDTVVHGIGVSEHFYSSRLVSRAVISILRRVHKVSVRDRRSRQTLAGSGVDAVLVRDPASTLFSAMKDSIDVRPDVHALVLLDRYRWPTFLPGDSVREAERAQEIEGLACMVAEWTSAGKSVEIFLFHSSDERIANDVVSATLNRGGDPQRIATVCEWDSCVEPFRLLMSCESVHTMRFHPGLAALLAGRQVDVVGDLQKLSTLRDDGKSAQSGWRYSDDFADPAAFLRSTISASFATGKR
ncbi:polysaccharide pyruvyl transferase family protein [Rhodococcus sp. DMU2021]|uniref:polysaccharide pyruvyl transferase family protein n=1 Tax=Rhodococcus sp. DMU2021 TaxID=2866997 RepID=UPI001C7D1EF3|nr:polysaccharide pyruvyl transferase family protein [Rhodococcus sp. DMU2021]MBX4171849.1 polysaccharide pyruvyl transferase family protein [Rhodococcus sp. DMU2021]